MFATATVSTVTGNVTTIYVSTPQDVVSVWVAGYGNATNVDGPGVTSSFPGLFFVAMNI